ncbi:MAG: tRNA-intron lyase [Candidatus Thorarchaeota archaeon]|nr:tRNA-intron lyase [Candidatus Thorarchaeota archaeon]
MSDKNGTGFEPVDLEDSEDDFIEEIELEEEPATTVFENGKGYVISDDADRISQQGFYGTRLKDGRLELEPVELLHLIERKRVVVTSKSGESVTAKDIVNQLQDLNPRLWVNYLVFRDLRSRGYAVRQGFGDVIGFRVYARGERPGAASANQLIYVLKEDEAISLTDLDLITETALASRKKLVFALVDQNGEVNYYKVSQATLPKIGVETNAEK